MAFTEFYVQNNGSNLNSGSDTNALAKYTSVNGNWNLTTLIFTPTDGSNPVSAGVAVGDFGSVYLDAAANTLYVARVTNVVNAVNGAITFSNVVTTSGGPTTGTTGRSVKIGGAWKGMGGTVTFPFSLTNLGNLKNVAGDGMRVLIKNDQVYTMGAITITVGTVEPVMIKGYTTTTEDDGRAVIVQNGANLLWNHQTDGAGIVSNIEFKCTFASGTQALVATGSSHTYYRCVFHGSRGNACSNGIRVTFVECEWYDNNKSNTIGAGCVQCDIDVFFIRCYFHDSTGANSHGLIVGGAGRCIPQVINCVFDSLSGSGILATGGATTPAGMRVINCDFYNMGVSGINFLTGSSLHLYVENSNFIKNAQYGIDAGSIAGATVFLGRLMNNGYGSGTMANGLGDTRSLYSVQETGKVVYAANQTPWGNPTSGDFNIVLAAAISAGRGAFLQTDPTLTTPNTLGYADIGAAPADATPFGGWAGSGILPDAYLGLDYLFRADYLVALTVTLLSGSLPPGLVLSQPDSSSYEISGRPTTLGDYTFTIRHVRGVNHTDVGYTISVAPGVFGSGTADGAEPLVIEMPRPTIRVRDPELASIIRRARRAARVIEDLSIVGASGDSESGFSL
jgi:hypothetical protein